jgi:6-pyruvoyltetrahydropterin/6-carboxytetrahydropterin synthase
MAGSEKMFTVSVETHFRASHQLSLPDGSTEPLHEHEWLVIANVSSENLDDSGFVIDFRQLKTMVDDIVNQLDMMQLQKISHFQRNNPSAENVAKYVYNQLEARLPKNLILQSIRIVEQLGYSAEFAKNLAE